MSAPAPAASSSSFAAVPMASPTAAPVVTLDPNAQMAGDEASASPSTKDKLKSKAFSGFMAGANLAKRGIKASIAKGKEVKADVQASEKYQNLKSDIINHEKYQKFKAALHQAFALLPVGVQTFLANPTADTILAHPENLFYVASLLEAVNHPEKAMFEAAIAGSAAVAMAAATAQHAGGQALNNAAMLTTAASHGAAAVATKYVPVAGSPADQTMKSTSAHIAQQRAAGQPVDAVAVVHHAAATHVATHVAQGVNNAVGHQIHMLTGMHMKPNFSPNEIKSIAGAIKPNDVAMLLRIMQTLSPTVNGAQYAAPR